MKILIVTQHIFPIQSPRSIRSTELIKELARRGHSVTVYAVLGKYDYAEFQRETGIRVKPLPIRWEVHPYTSDGAEWRNCFQDSTKADEVHAVPEMRLQEDTASVFLPVDTLVDGAMPDTCGKRILFFGDSMVGEMVAKIVFEIGVSHNVEQLFVFGVDIRTEAFDALIVSAPNTT